MKTNNSTSSGYTVNILCEAMRKTENGNLLFTIITFLFICTLHSCESNSTIVSESSITAVGEVAHISAKDKEAISNSSDIVFTGNDIQWFDQNTREIKFKKNIDCSVFQTYQKIHFNLDGKFLFTAQTYASQHHSFIIKDLVLFIDQFTQKCYLHDCYPLSVAENDPETKTNKEKRFDTWNSFLMQLRTEYKIK